MSSFILSELINSTEELQEFADLGSQFMIRDRFGSQEQTRIIDGSVVTLAAAAAAYFYWMEKQGSMLTCRV